jgi:hypothetical protein
LCLAEGTLAAGVVWKRDTCQVIAQVLDFLLIGLQSALHLTNPEFIHPFRVPSTLNFYHNVGREKTVQSSHVHPKECEGVPSANPVKI